MQKALLIGIQNIIYSGLFQFIAQGYEVIEHKLKAD